MDPADQGVTTVRVSCDERPVESEADELGAEACDKKHHRVEEDRAGVFVGGCVPGEGERGHARAIHLRHDHAHEREPKH